jgi:hypothetical protein
MAARLVAESVDRPVERDAREAVLPLDAVQSGTPHEIALVGLGEFDYELGGVAAAFGRADLDDHGAVLPA